VALFIYFYICFTLFYFHNTRQILIGVDGLAYLSVFVLVYFHDTHQVLVGLPQRVGGLAILFYFIPVHLVLVYFYNTHQVLEGLPQGVGGLAAKFPLF
jgi:hypothetical protein